MKRNNLKGSLILCVSAIIWGFAFVAQTDAGEKIPTFTFNAARSLIAAVFLTVLGLITKYGDRQPLIPKDSQKRKKVLTGGIVCGIMLAIALGLQQYGLTVYPEGVAGAARGGFLTALYVIIVPVITIAMGRKTSPVVGIAALFAIGGIYMLCLTDGFSSIYTGDIFLILCAVAFSLHIISIDYFVGDVGGIRLSAIQFIVCGIISAVLALCVDKINFSALLEAAPQILYVAIFSSGVAYTLQIIGQKYAEPAVATLSMSLESVFAAIGGMIFSKDFLGVREWIGCALVFAAIIIAQLPQLVKRKE